MKEDFDFVTLANYEKDLNEITEQSIAITEYYKRQMEAREAVIWAMVKAVGGKISINLHDLNYVPKNWEVREDPANKSRIFIIKPSHKTEATQ